MRRRVVERHVLFLLLPVEYSERYDRLEYVLHLLVDYPFVHRSGLDGRAYFVNGEVLALRHLQVKAVVGRRYG